VNHGDSIRRVAQMHEIAYSLLQRAIQAGGEAKARSQAYENGMALTIAEEEAQLLKNGVYTCTAGDTQHSLTYYGVW
jgi:hypothetical protein